MGAMEQELAWLTWTGVHMTPWKILGLAGASLFGLRWVLQFAASRRAGRPVIPRAFWVMSLCGSAMTLSYFVFSSKQDAVGVLQNLLPAATAAYSLWLDVAHRARARDAADAVDAGAASGRAGTAAPAEAAR